MMISLRKPTDSSYLIPMPKREPIPAAMISKVVFRSIEFIFSLFLPVCLFIRILTYFPYHFLPYEQHNNTALQVILLVCYKRYPTTEISPVEETVAK